MKILIDTHAFLWIIEGDSRISEKAKKSFLSDSNELFFSLASYWEIAIKISLKKLFLADNWRDILARELMRNGVGWLPVKREHIDGILGLPWIHRDPFDRLLIAQSVFEGMSVMTSDSLIGKYDCADIIW